MKKYTLVMRKKYLYLFSAILFMACNVKQDNVNSDQGKDLHPQENHSAQAIPLVLNNGAKWKADSSTMQNVLEMQKVALAPAGQALADYHETATKLGEGLQKLVKECRMKGPDHDALHLWLEPMMEKNKSLEKATDVKQAAMQMEDIRNHFLLFDKYFES